MISFAVLFFVSRFLVPASTASPSKRFHVGPEQVTPRLLPSKVDVGDVATATAPNDGLKTDICGWLGGDPGT